MSEITLNSYAEKQAEKAENLKAFSGIKLLHIKKQISLVLNQIGKDGIFDEYTKHDISHIDTMLNSLEWIIPEETKEKLTYADWLMLTLSIYFHDLGMLVTKDEYNNRHKTTFPTFKNSIMTGEYGTEYKEKIQAIDKEERQDRFIYQELVRKTHAERIKFWILNEINSNFEVNLSVIDEIQNLISNLDNMFKRDLALVCESHHLSDFEDFDKYKTNQQYGPSKDEIVNLHYSALILRTADLLHITSDRTPSIEYNLINPTDPISQEEWAKQMAVKAIRPQIKKNKDGDNDETIPKDTFEIIALFENETGFFGLISYINYANKQLKESYKFNEIAKKQFSSKYDFPWKNIDDSNIETKDFDKRQFEFILDQSKILDLLVGHTLYNDSTIVLRELTQNAIDATKLKKYELEEKQKSSQYEPKIKIDWNEKSRELSFIDNGTGMTLEIIENHLLKVGSSRYQDESFKKKYPNFSPISRFGIGLLTCFLIADDIDIITKSEENDKAILLKIKKVHGKYLLKYLSTDKINYKIKNHGTEIKLYVRSDVNLTNIENELKKWILIPNCELNLNNNGKTANIGYDTIENYLKSQLQDLGYIIDNEKIKIKKIHEDGITMAYALKYVEHLKEWNYLTFDEISKNIIPPIGTCIEGVRVDFNTPGFQGVNFFCIINTSGKHAPKTNVARSNIEVTEEKKSLLKKIYKLYLKHFSDEIENLLKEGFSITWAAKETHYNINMFTTNSHYYSNKSEIKIEDVSIYDEELSNIKCILIEQNGNRELISIKDLINKNHFWTIDCESYISANSLIKEVKSSNTSALSLLKTIYGEDESNTSNIDRLLCNQPTDDKIDSIIRKHFQVTSIKIIPEQRRLDLKWTTATKKLWEEILLPEEDYSLRISSYKKCYVQLDDIEFLGISDECFIQTNKGLYLLNNSEINRFLQNLITKLSYKNQEDRIALSNITSLITSIFYYKDLDANKLHDLFENRITRSNKYNLSDIIWSRVDRNDLIEAILNTKLNKYDTSIWYRRELY